MALTWTDPPAVGSNAGTFNTAFRAFLTEWKSNGQSMETTLDQILATGEVAEAYDSAVAGGYAIGTVVYDATTGFTYRALQTQAAGSVEPLSDEDYWGLIAGVGKAEIINALGSCTTNTTINLNDGLYVTATVGASITFAFTNPPASGYAGGFFLRLTNGGNWTITWPTSVSWSGGVAPALKYNGTDLLSFTTDDAGTTYRGARIWRTT